MGCVLGVLLKVSESQKCLKPPTEDRLETPQRGPRHGQPTAPSQNFLFVHTQPRSQEPSDEEPQQEEPPTESRDPTPVPDLEADLQELSQSKTGDECGDGPDVQGTILPKAEQFKMPEGGMLSIKMQNYVLSVFHNIILLIIKRENVTAPLKTQFKCRPSLKSCSDPKCLTGRLKHYQIQKQIGSKPY
ncbi:P antigen family member 1-like [Papio anubis]|uniref:P antigen family member 1-like n=1 Tax=Papio anubis TaxID=9555 RepID=UPI0012AD27C7|nr:P antigen family member 1-like [Papio anubis]